MKAGTFIQLEDGRVGTVTYHGPDGYGIQWGRVGVDMDLITSGNPLFGKAPDNWPYYPQAMLREPSEHSAKLWPGMECVGEEFEIVP